MLKLPQFFTSKKKLGLLLGCALVFFSCSPALALSSSDLQSINNDTVWYDPNGSSVCGGGGSTALVGSDNLQKSFNFFSGKGLSAIQASGILGNLEQESGQGLNPLAQQNGSNLTTPLPGVGFGIAQWTDSGRQQGLVIFAGQEGGQPGDLGVQLDYLWQELTNNYRGTYAAVVGSKTIVDATTQFMNGYEGPDPTKAHLDNRINYAQAVFTVYGGGGNSTSSDAASACATAINCSSSANTSGGLSTIRQSVVCIAQQELATWKAQPGYGNTFPAFPYAQTGLLKYTGGGYEEWCADFVSWVYKQANYPFSGGSSGGWRIAGVASIQGLGQQNSNFHWHPQSSGYTPQPGDLAIHGGNHVNIFVSNQGTTAQYIGGDQGGGPYGQANPPQNGAIVSTETGNGYYDNGITGYVSPD